MIDIPEIIAYEQRKAWWDLYIELKRAKEVLDDFEHDRIKMWGRYPYDIVIESIERLLGCIHELRRVTSTPKFD